MRLINLRTVCLAAFLLSAAVAYASSSSLDVTLARRTAGSPVPAAGSTTNATSSVGAPALFFGSPSTTSIKQERLAQMYAENEWKNSLVMWILPDSVRDAMPHWTQSWFRCWVMASLLYFGLGSLWSYYCYFCYGEKLYPAGEIPTFVACVEQMTVAFLGMPLYAALPTFTEFICEQGWTMSYARISDVGLPRYCLYFAMYMTSVEFFVYWQHRILHDYRPGYNWLHYIHHKYNKEHTLSPFAGLAFHPIDGILQALPYTWTLFYVPMHFLTHELLLFATAVWTTNIHDNIHVPCAPIMGAKYHTIHHTTYKHNYGHYTIYADKFFGTLISPEEYEAKYNTKRI